MDHITFWMPTFVSHIPVKLDKLFENGASTSDAFGGKPSGIMEVAVDVLVVFVIRVLWAEEGRTD